jgi:hypothetical protein
MATTDTTIEAAKAAWAAAAWAAAGAKAAKAAAAWAAEATDTAEAAWAAATWAAAAAEAAEWVDGKLTLRRGLGFYPGETLNQAKARSAAPATQPAI